MATVNSPGLNMKGKTQEKPNEKRILAEKIWKFVNSIANVKM